MGSLLEQALAHLRKSDKDSIGKAQVVVTSPFEAKLGSVYIPGRRSMRRASSIDEDSCDMASRLVAKRNLDFQQGTSFVNSFLSFHDKLVINNIQTIGIST